VPPDVAGERKAADWGEIIARFDLLAFDFQRHLHLRLTTVLNTHTWREFAALVSGLLSIDEHLVTGTGIVTIPATLIGAHFHTTDDSEEPTDE